MSPDGTSGRAGLSQTWIDFVEETGYRARWTGHMVRPAPTQVENLPYVTGRSNGKGRSESDLD